MRDSSFMNTSPTVPPTAITTVSTISEEVNSKPSTSTFRTPIGQNWVRDDYHAYKRNSHFRQGTSFTPMKRINEPLNPYGSYLNIDCAINAEELIDQWMQDMQFAIGNIEFDNRNAQVQ